MKLIECPRDAMQGIHKFIPTAPKAEYINLLLQVGFDTLDFGSFVSPKAVPQMQDTADVLPKLNLTSNTKLLAIIANLQGLESLVQHAEITYAGYPFSVSETFQLRNTNKTISQSLNLIDNIVNLCLTHQKTPVIYLSMGFGNPYRDDWNLDLLTQRTQELVNRDIKIISIADTVGVASSESIKAVFNHLKIQFPQVELGLHLHSRPDNWLPIIEAAYQSGCKRIDSAVRGFGGCPMASDTLTGNIATENVVGYLKSKGEQLTINEHKLQEAVLFTNQVFF